MLLRKVSSINDLLEGHLAGTGKSLKEESTSRRVTRWSLPIDFS